MNGENDIPFFQRSERKKAEKAGIESSYLSSLGYEKSHTVQERSKEEKETKNEREKRLGKEKLDSPVRTTKAIGVEDLVLGLYSENCYSRSVHPHAGKRRKPNGNERILWMGFSPFIFLYCFPFVCSFLYLSLSLFESHFVVCRGGRSPVQCLWTPAACVSRLCLLLSRSPLSLFFATIRPLLR